MNLKELDLKIRKLTNEDISSRPFLCRGSPIGCDVALVGINPATSTEFWPHWNTSNGFDKDAWLKDYLKVEGRLKPTRSRIETLCDSIKPLRCIELNLYSKHSASEKLLDKESRDVELFNFLIGVVRPRIILIHGKTPAKHIGSLFGLNIEPESFTKANYLGIDFNIIRSKRHFAYVSNDYVRELGDLLKLHLMSIKS